MGDGHSTLTGSGPSCGACGVELLSKSKFCYECGAAVTHTTQPSEYKHVTVLFADVVRSMDIAALLDMERYRELMTELVELSATLVRRYGGSVEYNGDGVMAIFGAPVALEDHAFRACLAALAIQTEMNRLTADAMRRDEVNFRLRIGLNSGQVIAGEIGTGTLGYAATGETVGMAQRMESVAPPGGVMLSQSTARLVEHSVTLGESQWVDIKGAEHPVSARLLAGVRVRNGPIGRAEASLVGRNSEMAVLDAIIERTVGNRGGVVHVIGPPGIGKSRVARETAALAARRGFNVIWAFCESHASDVPFHAVRRLLRALSNIEDVEDVTARARVRQHVPEADADDLALLDDLLGIADPEVSLPQIDPDARRRRLTKLINSLSLARTAPTLIVIEDAQWIDAVSESMLADFLEVVPRTPSMVLITSRPEYQGALRRVPGAETIALAPLSDVDTAALLSELLGSDTSVGDVAEIVADRAAGNPFFAEEMVRDLAQRGVLVGERGEYSCHAGIADLSVPVTVHDVIAARIDRLSASARRTLNAASVIGARFGLRLLTALDSDALVDDLLGAELIEQVRFAAGAEYAFRHPLIRAAAYESQLKSDRAEWHRRIAAAIELDAPESVDENAALIAEHLDSAGELRAAYGWHMRAGAWSTNRDLDGARVSWERARRIADALPDDDRDRLSMRIAPRTMLCATAWQTGQLGRAMQESHDRFSELRDLCTAAGDEVSLAIAMTALATELLYAGRTQEASRLASEQMALLESIGDPELTMALAPTMFVLWEETGKYGEVLRWSQTIIDLAGGDPRKGAGFGIGSPLAVALAHRGITRLWLGHLGWRQDLRDAATMARNSGPQLFVLIVLWTFGVEVLWGAALPDDATVRASEEAVQTAQRASNGAALSVAEFTLGIALLSSNDPADRQRGHELMTRDLALWQSEQFLYMVPVTELLIAREEATLGDTDSALAVMRQAVGELHRAGRLGFSIWGTGVLVETLLKRGTEHDLAEAQQTIERIANLPTTQDWTVCEISILRMRTLLAVACGEETAYRDFRDRYRAKAIELGFEGHQEWSESLP